MATVKVKCPNCGSIYECEEGTEQFTCSKCSTTFIVEMAKVKEEVKKEVKKKKTVKKKKKKAEVDPNATILGLNKERAKQAVIQGGMMLVFFAGLGVFAYIVSMIPAGIFGVSIAHNSTTDQGVYDIQNIALTIIGIAVMSFGLLMLGKKCGENDAMYSFRNNQPRTLDKRYLLLSVVLASVVYFIIIALLNIDFIAGPAKYLGIFLCRAERNINEGIKVPLIDRTLASLICLVFEFPCAFIAEIKGFKAQMEKLINEEEEEAQKNAEK